MSAPIVNSAPTPAPAGPVPLATSTPLVPSNQPKLPPTVPQATTKPLTATTPPSTNQINHNANLPLSLVQEKTSSLKPSADSSPKQSTTPTKPTTNGMEDSAAAKAPVNVANSEMEPPNPAEPTPPEAHAAAEGTPEPAQAPEKAEEVNENGERKSEEPKDENKSDKDKKESAEAEKEAEVDKVEDEDAGKKKEQKKVVKAPKRRRAPVAKDDEEPTSDEKKPRRARQAVQPYQIPSPEIITVLNRSLKLKSAAQKSPEEKIIVFFKNEYLAVRNADNGFYVCQVLQNVYKTSRKIRIRWLSKEEKETGKPDAIYTADFYDQTDFECILSNVALKKVDKNRFKLPKAELERVENILKRAIDVEKGVSEKPPPSEEHPDGIDVSLYREEPKTTKSGVKRKRSPSGTSPKRAKLKAIPPKKSTVAKNEAASKEKKEPAKKSVGRKKKSVKKAAEKKATVPEKPMSSRAERATNRQNASSPELKVSPGEEKARVVARVLRPNSANESPKASTSKAATKQLKATKSESSKSTKESKTGLRRQEKAVKAASSGRKKKEEEISSGVEKVSSRGTSKRAAAVASAPSASADTKKKSKRK